MYRGGIFMIVLFLTCQTAVIEIECPSVCVCDTHENYRRAICQHQNLAVVEAGIPPQVQLLDMSFNVIQELEDSILLELGLTHLKLLNLSHNRISQIHMNAFYRQNLLKTLDLSYNKMQYVLVNWFWDLTSLEELYLKGNNFRKISPGPLVESVPLKILDIGSCKILNFYEDTFSRLPSLEVLDVSDNLLTNIKPSTLEPLENLKVIKTDGNPWVCDDKMKDFYKYCRSRGISFENECEIATPENVKFQRMMELPKEEANVVKNSWIIDDEEKISDNNSIVIENCFHPEDKKDLLMEILELSPVLTILIPLLFGFTLGLIFGCSVQIGKPKKNKKITKRIRGRIVNSRRTDGYEYPLMDTDSIDSFYMYGRSRSLQRETNPI